MAKRHGTPAEWPVASVMLFCYSLFRHAFKRASDSAIVHLSSCTPSSLLASGRGHLEGY